jgi:hypothetical protein
MTELMQMGKLKNFFIDDAEWYDDYYTSQDVYESERRRKAFGGELDYQHPAQPKPTKKQLRKPNRR